MAVVQRVSTGSWVGFGVLGRQGFVGGLQIEGFTMWSLWRRMIWCWGVDQRLEALPELSGIEL
jgi:hypothetical protein